MKSVVNFFKKIKINSKTIKLNLFIFITSFSPMILGWIEDNRAFFEAQLSPVQVGGIVAFISFLSILARLNTSGNPPVEMRGKKPDDDAG